MCLRANDYPSVFSQIDDELIRAIAPANWTKVRMVRIRLRGSVVDEAVSDVAATTHAVAASNATAASNAAAASTSSNATTKKRVRDDSSAPASSCGTSRRAVPTACAGDATEDDDVTNEDAVVDVDDDKNDVIDVADDDDVDDVDDDDDGDE